MNFSLQAVKEDLPKLGFTKIPHKISTLENLATFLEKNSKQISFLLASVGSHLTQCIAASEDQPEIRARFIKLKLEHSILNSDPADFVKNHRLLTSINPKEKLKINVLYKFINQCLANENLDFFENQDFRELCDITLEALSHKKVSQRQFESGLQKNDGLSRITITHKRIGTVLMAKSSTYKIISPEYLDCLLQASKVHDVDGIEDLNRTLQVFHDNHKDGEIKQVIYAKQIALLEHAYQYNRAYFRPLLVRLLTREEDSPELARAEQILKDDPDDLLSAVIFTMELAFSVDEVTEKQFRFTKQLAAKLNSTDDYNSEIKDLSLVILGVICCDFLEEAGEFSKENEDERLGIMKTLESFQEYSVAVYFMNEAFYKIHGFYSEELIEKLRPSEEHKIGEFRSIIASYDLQELLRENSFNFEQVANIKNLQQDILLGMAFFEVRCMEAVVAAQEYLVENLQNNQEANLLEFYQMTLKLYRDPATEDENGNVLTAKPDFQRGDELIKELARNHCAAHNMTSLESLRFSDAIAF